MYLWVYTKMVACHKTCIAVYVSCHLILPLKILWAGFLLFYFKFLYYRLMVLKISSKFELRRFCRTTGAVAMVNLLLIEEILHVLKTSNFVFSWNSWSFASQIQTTLDMLILFLLKKLGVLGYVWITAERFVWNFSTCCFSLHLC